MTEAEQWELLKRTAPWEPIEKLAEGGGARVFKVVSGALVQKIMPLMMPPWSDRDRALKNAPQLLQLLSEIADGSEVVVAAAKVAKRVEDRLTKREIDILRDVKHPNMIRMFDYDKSEKPSWYVMPVMRGGTLHGKNVKGDVAVATRGMLRLARALVALHENDIVHRDVKPKNVFLTDSGDWILGDPGAAYRDDGLDETKTRFFSGDWAPRWHGFDYNRDPRVDLYMLAVTTLSVLVGGGKALAPHYITKPDFNLPELFPKAPGVGRLYDVIRSLFVPEPDPIPYKDARGLVPVLEALLPEVDQDPGWLAAQELARLRRAPRLLFTWGTSSTTQSSGDSDGLRSIPVWIPDDCVLLRIWVRGQGGGWEMRLTEEGQNGAQYHSPVGNDTQATMDIPPSIRGKFVRLTVAGHSNLLHSVVIYSESGIAI